MKRFVVFLCSILLVIGAAGAAGAAYYYQDHQLVNQLVDSDYTDRWAIWEHSLVPGEYEGDPWIDCLEFTLTLSITADDVDGSGWYYGKWIDKEDDVVYIYQGSGDPYQDPDTLFTLSLGQLLQTSLDILDGPVPEDPGVAGDLITTPFTILSSALGFQLDFSAPLYVGVLVEGDGLPGGDDWDVEIEESLLTIECTTPIPVPSALFLLGSGVIGLIGLRRKFK